MHIINKITNGIEISNISDFNPKHIFECGQCFRWREQADGSFIGVAFGKVVQIFYKDDTLTIINSNEDDFHNIWYNYFDLGTQYTEIKQKLSQDPVLETAINFGSGIRLLRQDLSEIILSFIISANNHIPRIMKIVDSICESYGPPISFNGIKYYSFPDLQSIAASTLEQINICRAGYRCNYILETSRTLAADQINFNLISELPTPESRKLLMKLQGVGPKVADCILLFSGSKFDVFPTDTWVRKVMKELYFGYEPTINEINTFASQKFGSLAGYAQQYLFYYARSNGIGT